MPDAGELFVGAYLEIIEKCDVVDYNVRTKDGGIEGLGELDVIGLKFNDNGKSTVYLCEVATHILGLHYGSNKDSVEKVQDKYKRQKKYAEKYLKNFDNHKYMFWSPRVPKGYMTEEFEKMKAEIDFVINEKYTKKFDELINVAKAQTQDRGNIFFRVLQIQTHLRKIK